MTDKRFYLIWQLGRQLTPLERELVKELKRYRQWRDLVIKDVGDMNGWDKRCGIKEDDCE